MKNEKNKGRIIILLRSISQKRIRGILTVERQPHLAILRNTRVIVLP